MRPPEELLYDSEASLRLVDHAIEELNASGAELDRESRGFLEHVMSQPGGFGELSRTLLRAYAETAGIVVRLRESCGMLDDEGSDRLQQMHGRLREVTAATEAATNDILDGLGRVVDLVDRLDEAANAPLDKRRQLSSSIKEELGTVVQHFQFQDITKQQLSHIASLLADMRRRITQIVTIFAPPVVSFAKDEMSPGSFDPNASASPAGVGDRQAVADEIFAIRAERKTA